MISSAPELLHELTHLYELCFLDLSTSNVSGEANTCVARGYSPFLETSHLSLSQVCANHFDTGKSTVCLAVLEDCHALLRIVCQPFAGMKNMPGIIFLSGRREGQQLPVGQGLPRMTWPGNRGAPEAATAQGIRHLPGARDGLRLGQDIGLWLGPAQWGPWLGRARLWGAGDQHPTVWLWQGLGWSAVLGHGQGRGWPRGGQERPLVPSGSWQFCFAESEISLTHSQKLS